MKIKEELTLPNYLSMLRLILAPFVLFFILKEFYIPAIIIFTIAALSDVLDGYIARKTKITKLGSALDPLADKVLIILTMIGLAIKFEFPLWALGIFLFRDIPLIIISIIVYDGIKEFKATIVSKINTWFQVAAIIGYVIDFRFKNLILLIAVILTIISIIEYIKRGLKTKK